MNAPSRSSGNACQAAYEPSSKASSKTLRRLWERMVSLYGHLWVSRHGLTPHEPESTRLTISGDTWARALSGLSGSQIANGLASCLAEGSEFPPSVPRFRRMCYGIASFAAVHSELRAKMSPPSPLARAVWAELDTFRYRQASADRAERLLREAYELVVERTMRGVPLPHDPVAVIEQEIHNPMPATPEQRAKHIAHIHDLLHGHHPDTA